MPGVFIYDLDRYNSHLLIKKNVNESFLKNKKIIKEYFRSTLKQIKIDVIIRVGE